jgi:hypothetical protein
VPMSDEKLHWPSEPEWAPCVVCAGERRYTADAPAEPRRRRWWRSEPKDDRCPHCGAR